MLDRGADINIRDGYGRTPLHKTVEQSQFADVVLKAKFLIDHGAKVNIQAKNSNSTLFDAGQVSYKYTPNLFRYLISRGADVKLTGIDDITVLHQLMTSLNPEAIDLIQQVIAAGGNVNGQDKKGNTSLHYLARKPHANAIAKAKLLLKTGAKLDIKNKASQTPFELAQEQNNIEMVEFLSKSP
jgi:ankyrin repeat protein